MNYSSNTFSVSYKLRHDKIKHGKAPITLKITVNGQKAEVFVKRKIKPEKWHDRKKVIGTSPEVKAFNRYLDKCYHQAHEVYEKLLIEKQPISAARIKNLLLGKEIEEEVTLLYLTKYHNEHMASSLSHNTIKHYETTESYLKKFLKQKKNVNDVFLQQITYKFIIGFESFLRNWKPTDYKRPMNNNGVMKHMTRLRKLMNLAIKMEWMEKYPFKNYRVKYQSVTRECLTEGELKTIEEREFSISRLRVVRDIFIFCCYTGLSYIDAYNLKEENIVIGIDGEKWISFKRQKTKTVFQVPLLPKALDILYKYKNYPRLMEERALPLFSNQKTNSYLKEIADLCGIRKSLTFHLARHTFATTGTLTNGVPIESVSKMLGHTKIATTQIYAKVIEKKVGEDMQALRSKLKVTVNQDRKNSNSNAS